MATTFNFTISSDNLFPNKKVALDRFEKEIRDSSITVALASVVIVGGDCVVTFKTDLSAGEETTLSGLVQAHSGEPLVPDLQAVELYSGTSPAPFAADGKLFTLPNIFPGEVLLNFSGSSDKVSAPVERWGGTLFGLQQVGVGQTSFSIDLLDGIFLAGGHIDWDGGAWGSYVYMELVAPASTTKAPASPGTGNCNKVPTGFGFNIIVPAAGNGQYDLDAPVPVPANNDETNAQVGYWNYSEPWLGKGVVTAGTPGASKYNLYDAELELAHFAKLHLFRTSGQRDLIAPAIKPKWILPEWKMKVIISNADTGTLSVGWDLLIARRKSV